MREIKFRALYRGKWIYFTIDDLVMINHESMTDEDYAIYNHDPITRGQYIGRKDSQGKEIYEGDILQGLKLVQGDESQHGRGKNQHNFSTKKTITATVAIKYNSEYARFVCDCKDKNTYFTGFYRGCGRTKSEINRNAYKQITVSVSVEMDELKNFEVIGNIYENPELIPARNGTKIWSVTK